jgi:uncharacterized protein (DUF58 family)
MKTRSVFVFAFAVSALTCGCTTVATEEGCSAACARKAVLDREASAELVVEDPVAIAEADFARRLDALRAERDQALAGPGQVTASDTGSDPAVVGEEQRTALAQDYASKEAAMEQDRVTRLDEIRAEVARLDAEQEDAEKALQASCIAGCLEQETLASKTTCQAAAIDLDTYLACK